MRVLILGNVNFTYKIIESLLKKKILISGIVSQNQKNLKDDYCSLKKIAKKNLIPYIETKNINSNESIAKIIDIKFDLIISIGWSQIIKENFFKKIKKLIIGYHPSNLPINRGRHPIIWTLILNLKKTASTFFLLNNKIDDGEIIDKKIIIVPKKYTSKELYDKLCKTAEYQIISILKKIKTKKLKILKIKKNSKNYWRLRNKKDGIIDWRMNSSTIYNLIRALNRPYAGAIFLYNNFEYKVFKSKMITVNNPNIEPGKIIKKFKNGSYIIKTADNGIKISCIEPSINLKENSYL